MAKRPVPKYDFKAFGAAIKAARTGRKESRKKVSDEMFISPRYLANIENKGQHPSLQIFFELMESRYMVDVSEMQKERERLEARNREIDDMFLSLYTDKAKGVLSEQRFMKLTTAMEQEQEENQCRLQELMRMLQQSDAQKSEVRTFIREIRQYATIQELDETVLNRLISRILVGEVKKVDGQKVQEVRIVYNFIGELR